MKHFLFQLFIAIIITNGFSQGQISFEQAKLENHIFSVTLHISAEDAPFFLGNHNLRLQFPSDVLANPRIEANSYDKSLIMNCSLSGSRITEGKLSVNTSLNKQTQTALISKEGKDLLRISFDVVGDANEIELAYLISENKNNTIVLAADGGTLSVTATPFSYKKQSSDEINANIMRASPNPFIDMLNVSFNSKQAGTCTIYLTDMLGNIHQKQQVNAQKGDNQLILDGTSLSGGMYLIYTQTENQQQVTKIWKE